MLLAQLHYIFSQVEEAAQVQLELFVEENYAKALRLINKHPGNSAFRAIFRILDNTFENPN